MRIAMVVLGCLLAGCGREQWRAVDARLQDAAAAARDAGLEPLSGRNNEFGTFDSSATGQWTLTLDSGRTYFLAAACAPECGGVDLEIDLPDGTGLVRDSSARQDARLSFVARQSGEHAVRLAVARCVGGGCRWAAQLYAAPAAR
jgi:hypothetical protein